MGLVAVWMAGIRLGFFPWLGEDSCFFLLVGASLGSFGCWGLLHLLNPGKAGSRNLSRRMATVGLYVVVLLSGHMLASINRTSIDRILPLSEGRSVRVTGIIVGDPQATQDRSDGLLSFPLEIETLLRSDATPIPAHGRMEVKWRIRERDECPAFGQRWSVVGTLRGTQFTGFAPQAFGRPGKGGEENVRCLFITPGEHRMLNDTTGWRRWVRGCYELRRASARYLSAGIADCPEHVGLLQALLLGSRQQLSPRMREAFAATGTLHIFAISGLHVAIVGLFAVMVLRSFRVSRQYWILALAPVLIVYTLATGARPSAVRACVMGIAYYLAPLAGRRSDVFTSLSLAAMGILAFAPSQLMESGFILSFAVVTGLVILYPPILRSLDSLWRADPMIPIETVQAEPRWQRAGRWTIRYTCQLAALSASAWLVSLPLTAFFFGRFSPIALVCNILVIPLNFLMVLSGALSMLLGPCIAWLAEVFNHANLVLIHVTVALMEGLGRIPCGSFRDCWVPAGFVWTWFLVLGAVMVILRARAAGENSCDGRGEMIASPTQP